MFAVVVNIKLKRHPAQSVAEAMSYSSTFVTGLGQIKLSHCITDNFIPESGGDHSALLGRVERHGNPLGRPLSVSGVSLFVSG